MSGSDRKVRKTLLTIGLGGTVLAALCCVTPLLAVVLGALGLAAWLGAADYALLPLLAVFVGITVYALFGQRPRSDAECSTAGNKQFEKSK